MSNLIFIKQKQKKLFSVKPLLQPPPPPFWTHLLGAVFCVVFDLGFCPRCPEGDHHPVVQPKGYHMTRPRSRSEHHKKREQLNCYLYARHHIHERQEHVKMEKKTNFEVGSVAFLSAFIES